MGIIIALVLSYLVGAIPSSIWVGKIIRGIDIRDYGSGNPGTTNTFRILGWKVGIIVGLIDLLKGFTATFFISQLVFTLGSTIPPIFNWEPESMSRILAGLAAVLGHLYPVYARFQGGKGVLTAAGVLLAIEPISVLFVALIFVLVLFPSHYVSLASMTASFSYPLILIALRRFWDWPIDGSTVVFGILLAIGIILKHHSNIRRLLKGNENRISSFKPAKGWLNKKQSA